MYQNNNGILKSDSIKIIKSFCLDSINSNRIDTLFQSTNIIHLTKIKNETQNDSTFIVSKIDYHIKQKKSKVEIIPIIRYSINGHEQKLFTNIDLIYQIFEDLNIEWKASPLIVSGQSYVYNVNNQKFHELRKDLTILHGEKIRTQMFKRLFNVKGNIIVKYSN